MSLNSMALIPALLMALFGHVTGQLVLGTGPGTVGDEADFDTFVAASGKVYSSPEEVTYRRQIFDANKARIEAHNAQDLPFKLGVTQFADLTTDEFDSQMGFRGLLLDNEPLVGTAPDDLLGYWGSGWDFPPLDAWSGYRGPTPTPVPVPPTPVAPSASAAPAQPSVAPSPAGASPAAPSPAGVTPAGASPAAASASASRAPAAVSPSRTPAMTPSRTPTRTPVAASRTPTPTPSRAPSKGPVVAPSIAPTAAPVSPTGTVDWVAAGKVTPVVNQGSCGSCYAFATVASIESLWAIKSGTLPSDHLSPQQVVDCSANSGCNGGAITTVFNYVKSAGGVCWWTDYTYTASQGTCRATSCTKPVTITGYANVAANNQAAMETALQSQPVVVAVQASGSAWQLYRSGVMTTSCGTALDHAVLAVGYGTDSSTSVNYWKIKNSWGASWGESGYVRLARGGSYNGAAGQCGILMAPAYPKM